MSLLTTPAILLRSHPYSESSRILRFLTPDAGLVAMLARGVKRGGSKGRDSMETFDEGTLVFDFRAGRDLHSFREFHPGSGRRPLGTDVRRFAGASLLAELLLTHTLEGADPALYEVVRSALAALGSAPPDLVPARILSGAWSLVSRFGFPPELERCVQCGTAIGAGGAESELPRFDVAAGGLRCSRCSADGGGPRIGPGARAQLRSFCEGELPDDLAGVAAHLKLLERFCLHHLAGRRAFASFALLHPLIRD